MLRTFEWWFKQRNESTVNGVDKCAGVVKRKIKLTALDRLPRGAAVADPRS